MLLLSYVFWFEIAIYVGLSIGSKVKSKHNIKFKWEEKSRLATYRLLTN